MGTKSVYMLGTCTHRNISGISKEEKMNIFCLHIFCSASSSLSCANKVRDTIYERLIKEFEILGMFHYNIARASYVNHSLRRFTLQERGAGLRGEEKRAEES